MLPMIEYEVSLTFWHSSSDEKKWEKEREKAKSMRIYQLPRKLERKKYTMPVLFTSIHAQFNDAMSIAKNLKRRQRCSFLAPSLSVSLSLSPFFRYWASDIFDTWLWVVLLFSLFFSFHLSRVDGMKKKEDDATDSCLRWAIFVLVVVNRSLTRCEFSIVTRRGRNSCCFSLFITSTRLLGDSGHNRIWLLFDYAHTPSRRTLASFLSLPPELEKSLHQHPYLSPSHRLSYEVGTEQHADRYRPCIRYGTCSIRYLQREGEKFSSCSSSPSPFPSSVASSSFVSYFNVRQILKNRGKRICWRLKKSAMHACVEQNTLYAWFMVRNARLAWIAGNRTTRKREKKEKRWWKRRMHELHVN